LPDLAKKFPGALGMPYPKNKAPILSWTQLYDYLIVSRASDQSVGKLQVT